MYFCVVLCIVCFVTFPVLFVCICVLYYCHRVATQLQLNISYYIIAKSVVTVHTGRTVRVSKWRDTDLPTPKHRVEKFNLTNPSTCPLLIMRKVCDSASRQTPIKALIEFRFPKQVIKAVTIPHTNADGTAT
jgi:hypothetical protein